MKTITKIAGALAAASLAATALSGCGKSEYAAGAKKGPESKAEGKPAAAGKKATDDHKDEKKGAHGDHAEEGSVLKLSDADIAGGGIKTAKVAQEVLRAGITVSATIQPNRDRYAHVSPRVPGKVLQVPAKAGDEVRAGQVLALLDSVEIGESTSAYHQAASQFAVAKADFERADGLYKEQVIPQKDHLRAKSEFEKARAALTAATDKLRMMGVSPSSGQSSSTLPVTSPFAGTVIEKTAVIGEMAQPDKALFTVADLSTVWIEANLAERDLARMKTGSEASVTVTAYPEVQFKGRLVYVSAVVDRESRTVKGRIEIPNGDRRLKPEMFASARIATEERGSTIAVPTEAVVLLDNRSNVFVKEVDGFEARPVELGEVVGDRQIVKSGLHVGEEVVIAGVYALKSRLLKSKLGEGHAH